MLAQRSAQNLDDLEHPSSHAQGLGPESGRAVRKLHHRLHPVHESVELRFVNHPGGCDLEYHEIVPTNLAVDRLVTKQPHHQHLSERAGWILANAAKRIFSLSFLGARNSIPDIIPRPRCP